MHQVVRVLVTGGHGMVGTALVARLRERLWHVLAPARDELDLRDAAAVDRYMAEERPDVAFLVGARVGGIAANIADPVGFLRDNLLIEMACLEACRRHGVKRTVFLGSSCMYPRACRQPMREEDLYTGPLEPTNHGYALAKLVGLDLARAYSSQFGLNVITLIPCNLYGTGDTYDLARSHVVSALVRRFVDAAETARPSVTLWGTGSARRELMHVHDLGDAMLHFLDHYESPQPVNVGTGEDVTIRELAALVAAAAGYRGEILWDPAHPDGMPRKCLDVSRMIELGFRPRISLADGIERTVAEYRQLKQEGRVQ